MLMVTSDQCHFGDAAGESDEQPCILHTPGEIGTLLRIFKLSSECLPCGSIICLTYVVSHPWSGHRSQNSLDSQSEI